MSYLMVLTAAPTMIYNAPTVGSQCKVEDVTLTYQVSLSRSESQSANPHGRTRVIEEP